MDSVLLSIEAEKLYDEFTGGISLKNISIQDVYHNNSNNLEATFVKFSVKIHYFITEFIDVWQLLLFSHRDGQKIENIVSF